MDQPSTSQETGALTEAQAAEAFAQLLDPQEAPEEASEALEEETPQAEDEDADEAEPSEDESEEDAETDDDQPEEPQTYTVKINGEEVQVPLEEALKGYSRTQDYIRKTQELANERKAFAEEKSSWSSERERLTNLLTTLQERLADPDDSQELEYLRVENPGEYAARVAEKMHRQQLAQAAAAERAKLDEQAKQEEAQRQQAAMREEMEKLLSIKPEWRDQKVAQKEYAEILEGIKAYGFTERDLLDSVDHRVFLIAQDAAKYRALKAKPPQPKPKAETVPVVRPGATTKASPKVGEATRAKQRLAKTGRQADAAEAFFHLLPD